MALEKTVGVDQIEVVGIGTVQVREATVITEDGKQISKTYHRHCVTPGQDYSAEEPLVGNSHLSNVMIFSAKSGKLLLWVSQTISND